MKIIILIAFVLSFISCQTNSDSKKEINKNHSENNNKYATNFSIEKHDGYKILKVHQPWKGENKTINYILYTNKKPKNLSGTFIQTPIKSIVCLSLTHLAFIEKINEINSIVGIAGIDYVSSKNIIHRINSNKIKEVGLHEMFNYEVLAALKPELVMAYGIDQSSSTKFKKLEDLQLTTVLNAEYMELHPLGKAEWIKFVAAFYNKEQLADSIFNFIEKEYIAVKSTVEKVANQPTVFTGMPWNGAWHVPGGASFQAQFFKDAKADYIFDDNNEERSVIKSKEVIIDKCVNANFWLNVNAFNNLDEIIAQDEVLENFAAVKNKKVYNNNNRVNPKMGNDYWESGVVEPHIILKDLIKIFHPKKIEHELVYYNRLE